jgi:hypothetical protein
MLLLTSTSDIIRVVTGSAADIDVHASYVDNNAGTITPGRTNTPAITSATTTTVVASPGSGVQRNVKFLNITNAHATVSTVVTVQHFDGTNSEDLIGVTLLAGENLVFTSTGDWMHHDAQGAEYGYTVPAPPNNGLTNTIAQTIDRSIGANSNTTAGVSGTLYLNQIYLTAGQLVSNISISSGSTAFTSPTNQFFALYSGAQTNPALLAQSANQTTTAWAANTIKTLAMTTPYRVPNSGVYYIGVMVTATTMGTWAGGPAPSNTNLTSAAPILHASSTTGLTTALPNPAANPTGAATIARFYAAVS